MHLLVELQNVLSASRMQLIIKWSVLCMIMYLTKICISGTFYQINSTFNIFSYYSNQSTRKVEFNEL